MARERKHSNFSAVEITDADVLMIASKFFLIEEKLQTIEDQYIKVKAQLKKLKLQAELTYVDGEEVLADFRIAAKATPEIKNAISDFGFNHVHTIAPFRDSEDNNKTNLAIISNDDISADKQANQLSEIINMLNMHRKKEEEDED